MFPRLALIIGIGNYREAPLEYCPPSAIDIRDLLVSEQYGQCDPKRSELVTDLEESISQERMDEVVKSCLKKVDWGETFIFYYAGHADTIGNELFLITDDCDETVDGYRLSHLLMEIRDRKITGAILIIDACQSSAALDALGLLLKGKLNKNTAILASCGRHQFAHQEESLKRSLFAHYFCEGVRNGCKGENREGNEIVDIITMKDYINGCIARNYPLLAKRQEARLVVAEGNKKLWISRVPASRDIPVSPLLHSPTPLPMVECLLARDQSFAMLYSEVLETGDEHTINSLGAWFERIEPLLLSHNPEQMREWRLVLVDKHIQLIGVKEMPTDFLCSFEALPIASPNAADFFRFAADRMEEYLQAFSLCQEKLSRPLIPSVRKRVVKQSLQHLAPIRTELDGVYSFLCAYDCLEIPNLGQLPRERIENCIVELTKALKQSPSRTASRNAVTDPSRINISAYQHELEKRVEDYADWLRHLADETEQAQSFFFSLN